MAVFKIHILLSPVHRSSPKKIQELLQASEQQLILILLSAPWSGNAHILKTYLKSLENELASFKCFIIDTEKEPKTMEHFGVSEIPTILFLRNKEIVHNIVTLISKKDLHKRLESFL